MDTDETKDPLEILRLAQEDRRAEPAPTETGERRDWRDLLTGALLALILIAGATGVAWQFYGERLRRPEWVERLLPGKAHRAGAAALRDVYYCPMHKDYQSDKPGNCPICSMQLVKKEKSAMAAESPAPVGASGPRAEPNTIFLAPQQQQLTGVRTEPAGYRHLAKEIRAAGKIAYDETRVTHIHTKVSGWIEHVFVDFAGKFVRQGDPLFTFYSPDLVATQEEYLLALRAQKDLASSSFERVTTSARSLVEASRQRLRLWDVTDEEVSRLEKEGKALRTLTVYSPVGGLVTERAAYHHGRYVSPEMDLYTIVDLSRVWALGEIYEYELPLVKTGEKTEIEMPYEQGAPPLRGTVNYVYPYLNPATRTGQIRMEFPNPSYALKPDMFVNVKLRINLGRQLTVPEDAVFDTGTEQYVFVDKGNGYFEPRKVKLGVQAEGYYAITEGLRSGERVATAANFILDSESRLKGAFGNMGAPQVAAAKPAEQLQIQLRTDPSPAKVGDNSVWVRVADVRGSPVHDASVRVRVSMPAMGSMPPMNSEAVLASKGNGEYSGTLKIPLAWTWQTTVTVERAGEFLGSAQFSIIAR